MIVIIDYGIGNLASVLNMFKKIGTKDVMISGDPDQIYKADKILLPGVGAFDTGMANLENSNLIPVLQSKVLKEKVPLLGICLGMQLLTNKSEEGLKAGLGFIDAETIKFKFTPEQNLKIPHMGWNYIKVQQQNKLIALDTKHRFYFVHSYYVKCNNLENSIATANYGLDFSCMINRENIYGAQFHPEKSLKFGMEILSNFSKI